MVRTVEAIIDEKGQVSLLEPVYPPSARRALVTILDEDAVAETVLLSEAVLSEDWDRPEEDAAWAHLRPKAARAAKLRTTDITHRMRRGTSVG